MFKYDWVDSTSAPQLETCRQSLCGGIITSTQCAAFKQDKLAKKNQSQMKAIQRDIFLLVHKSLIWICVDVKKNPSTLDVSHHWHSRHVPTQFPAVSLDKAASNLACSSCTLLQDTQRQFWDVCSALCRPESDSISLILHLLPSTSVLQPRTRANEAGWCLASSCATRDCDERRWGGKDKQEVGNTLVVKAEQRYICSPFAKARWGQRHKHTNLRVCECAHTLALTRKTKMSHYSVSSVLWPCGPSPRHLHIVLMRCWHRERGVSPTYTHTHTQIGR